MYSIDFDCRSGYFSSASFSLFVYAAWCLSWWISIVRASMCGSRALVAYGRSGSLKGYAIFELSSRLSAVRHAHGWICLSPCAKQGSGRSEEHTSELQSREKLVCRLLLEKNK